MAIYKHRYYGDMSVIIESRKNDSLRYLAFMDLQSSGCDKRKQFRKMTTKEFKSAEEYLKNMKNKVEIIEKALSFK